MESQRGVWLMFTGAGNVMPDSYFDPKQLAIGIEVEMEHTRDPRIAKTIAKDHLAESPSYYKYLAVMEQELENEKKIREIFGW